MSASSGAGPSSLGRIRGNASAFLATLAGSMKVHSSSAASASSSGLRQSRLVASRAISSA